MRSPILSTCTAPVSPPSCATTIGPLPPAALAAVRNQVGQAAPAARCGRAARSHARRPRRRRPTSSARSVSTMASSGMPNDCPPASTVITWVTSTLNGSVRRTVVPCPSSRARFDLRRRAGSTAVRTASMPTPRPESSVTAFAVEARQEDQIQGLLVAHGGERLGASPSARSQRGALDLRGVDARPVVRHLDDDMLAGARRAQREPSRRAVLPAAASRGGLLDAVIERVAHEVHERLGQRLDDRLVGFRVLALDDQGGGLVQLGRTSRAPAAGSAERPCAAAARACRSRRAAARSPSGRAPRVGASDRARHRRASRSASLTAWPSEFLATMSSPGQAHERVDSLGAHADRLRTRSAARPPGLRARLQARPRAPRRWRAAAAARGVRRSPPPPRCPRTPPRRASAEVPQNVRRNETRRRDSARLRWLACRREQAQLRLQQLLSLARQRTRARRRTPRSRAPRPRNARARPRARSQPRSPTQTPAAVTTSLARERIELVEGGHGSRAPTSSASKPGRSASVASGSSWRKKLSAAGV